MAERKKLVTSLALTLGLIGLNLVAFNALLAGWPSLRVDLTEEGLYSISPATRRLLSSLDEDVTIYGYFSRRTHPKLAPLVPQIEDMLDEYRALSNGRVKVEIIDPGENDEAEQEANDRYGVESTPFRLASKYEAGIVNAYFALVVKYGDQYVRYGFDDLIEVEPMPDGDIDVHLRNLEYDLTRAIKKVVYGFRSTAELFERVQKPVHFTAIISEKDLPEVFKKVPDAVRKAADELKTKGGEKFSFEVIDPSGDQQKQAELYQQFGARPMTLGLFGDEQFYLYGFVQSGDRLEQVPLTGEDVTAASVREAVEDVLRRQAPGFLTTVGVVTPAPSLPPELMMQLRMQGRMPQQPPPEFQQVKKFLARDYQVRDVDLSSEGGVPAEIDTLLVLKPKNFKEREIFNLDQYLMRGGRVILCDENYQADFSANGLQVSPIDSGLGDWLGHLGIDIPKTLVLDDRNQPLPIPEIRHTALGTMRTWRMAPYPYLVEVRDEGLANREVAAKVGAIGIYWGSPITLDKDKIDGLKTIDILKSSARSWTSDDLSRVSHVDYEVPDHGTEPHLLSVALTGKFKSYFAGKEPPKPEPPAGGEKGADETKPPPEVVLGESPETRMVVVSNAEFLSDFVARALGTAEGGFFSENLAFLQNVIDWINLDNDMIGIRSRGAATRRIEHVERDTEIGIEGANYVIPVILLLALASWRFARRRNTRPIIEVRVPAAPQTTRRVEG